MNETGYRRQRTNLFFFRHQAFVFSKRMSRQSITDPLEGAVTQDILISGGTVKFCIATAFNQNSGVSGYI